MTAFREIRGVQQRGRGELRRWFQSPFFDLFTTQDGGGELQWFQLCYARDTWRERVLEWRRGRGFLHLKLRDSANPAKKDSGELLPDGLLPYREVADKFALAGGLPPAIHGFVAEKLREYARPARRFPAPRARAPKWLQRLRFLDRARSDR
jgi:hypothetical protein